GGLVLEGGRGLAATAPPIISRLPFPPAWRVILVLDPSRSGVHGAEEGAAFASLPPFPAEEAAHHCRLILMKALPAVAEGDLASFGAAVRELQARAAIISRRVRAAAGLRAPASPRRSPRSARRARPGPRQPPA